MDPNAPLIYRNFAIAHFSICSLSMLRLGGGGALVAIALGSFYRTLLIFYSGVCLRERERERERERGPVGAADRGIDPRRRQTKFFKIGSRGFPPWRSGLWE